ncbi:MAG: antibiotic biosynthesis monooxygenase [Sediminibacterium sp.]|nr:antibiotic biosynthesis monooxygenase [Sediminibacterium sp.]
MFKRKIIILLPIIILSITGNSIQAQEKSTLYRIAKIKIDSNHVNEYYLALHEQMESAIQKEPGVLSYTALANKNNPAEITIIEVYASPEAYQAHIQTAHFLKYKQTVKDWVLALELIDQKLIASAKQGGF